MPVTASLAVRLVVLVVVGNEIVQGETVMGGDEVDRRPGSTPLVPEDVRRTGKPAAELRDQAGIALPEPTNRIAERGVPFRPAGRKAAKLIPVRADIPRLGDQLH